jgi:ABC-type cobalamin/Fe3+-siderophores transport system ATPase subunit
MDSGWLSLENINCLVGTNESGKTNLLVALWKLRPSNQEAIVPLRDYPRSHYDEYEEKGQNSAFIYAHLVMPPTWVQKAAQKSGFLPQFCQTAIIARNFSGTYSLFWAKPQVNACLPILQNYYEH